MPTKRQKVVIAALEACRDKRGRILPRAVWQAAKADPKHPLHKNFPWDIKVAAEHYWDELAAKIITRHKLIIIHGKARLAAPYFVSDPTSRESAYVLTSAVMKREEMAETVMLAELKRIEDAIRRARTLSVTFGLEGYFERMLEDVVEARGKMRKFKEADDEERPPAS